MHHIVGIDPQPLLSPTDGYLWSYFKVATQMQIQPHCYRVPYCRENLTLVGHPVAPEQFDPFSAQLAIRPSLINPLQHCPYCQAQLFLTPTTSHCCNLRCPARRTYVLWQQLVELGLPCDAWVSDRLLSDASFQLTTLAGEPTMLGETLRYALRHLALSIYLKLFGLPPAAVEALENRLVGQLSPQALYQLVLSGALVDQLTRDPHLAELHHSLLTVNREAAATIAAVWAL